MEPIIAFLIHHWALSLALLIAILILMVNESYLLLHAAQQVAPSDLVQMINKNAVKVIDLRTAEEFKKGHIISSVSISLSQLKKDLKLLNAFQSQDLVLVHHANQPLNPLIGQLLKNSFKNVKVLKGGIEGWIQADLPLEKSK